MSNTNILSKINPINYGKVLEEYEHLKSEFTVRAHCAPSETIEEFLLLNAINNVMDHNCPEQYKHFVNLSHLVSKFSRHFGLSGTEIKDLVLVAKYHDIGKININPDILNKPSKLNDEEWQEIKTHTTHSYEILNQSTKFKRLAPLAAAHHERFDGTGYPNGLKGEEIPLISRIVCVFDAYEVMTSGRVYKAALTHEQAVDELNRCAGTQFDPNVVEAFAHVVSSQCELNQ